MTRIQGHGGIHVADALRAGGVDRIYTLIGGHIFAVLDGAEQRGVQMFDFRHELQAAFAAEAHGKLTRAPGVVVTDAGPGVMNTMNAVVSAQTNGSPMVLLAGRAPKALWGMGALNEVEQTPVFAPVTKSASTVLETTELAASVARAVALAGARPRGPVYVDLPMDVLMGDVTVDLEPAEPVPTGIEGDLGAAIVALSEAERPVLLLGSDVWMDHGEAGARSLAEKQRIPAFAQGMGRGILPADHALAFSAARGAAFKRADLVIVAGTPLDFRLGFGSFGAAKVIHLASDPSLLAKNVTLGAAGSLGMLLTNLAEATPRDRDAWVAELRAIETERRAGQQAELRTDTSPIHPSRVYGELVPRLGRDSIVIADGGDFASYAGKYVDVFEPGSWLDPGPYGCLGTSAGYALAAGTLNPGRRVVVLLGDGAAGFSLGDWDTLVRFGVDVTFVCGNNGVWGLEKQPMRMLYGREVLADLRPETRYDEVMRGFGGHGELCRAPEDIGPALDRALATQGPSLVNVITDAEVSYPRGGSMT